MNQDKNQILTIKFYQSLVFKAVADLGYSRGGGGGGRSFKSVW